MIKVLYDTNIVLDVALKREPFFQNSLKAINFSGIKVKGYINLLTLVNTFYYARKETGIEKAREFIRDLLNSFELAYTDKPICLSALESGRNDFEDAVQEFSAIYSGVSIIVTRNTGDFKNSQLQVFDPTAFIEWMKVKF